MAQSIKKVSEKIIASKEFNESSDEDKVKILIQLCFCIFDQCRIDMVRRYGKVKFFNTCHVKAELNSVEPPSINFDIH